MKKILSLAIPFLLACSTFAGGIIAPRSISSAAAYATFVKKAGDTMTGPLTTTSMTVIGGMTVDTASSTFVVDSVNHRVGILTASPSTTLTVGGAVTVNHSGSGQVANFNQTNASNIALIRVNSPTDATNRPSIVELARANSVKFSFGLGYNTNDFHISSGTQSSGIDSAVVTVKTVSGNVGIGTTAPATKLHISSGTITMIGTGSPTTGGALCLNASNAMSKCTSAVDDSGNCTCP